MKRLALLLLLLLCAAAPVFAQPPLDEYAAVNALYPDAAVIACAGDEDDAFLILQPKDGAAPRLCILRRENGAWALALDSEKALCDPERWDAYNRYVYDRIELAWDGATLSIIYRYRTVIRWQYDFTRTEAGEWRFDRLCYEDGNGFCDELTYADGFVHDVFTRTWRDGTSETTVYPPCPMPWLASCETLAGFDASAFPMDIYGLSEEDLTRVAAELLPGYTLVDGKFSSAVTMLMDNPAGERVFMGGVYEDGAWVWTESTPLPAETGCDSYHAGDGVMSIAFLKPGGEPNEWGEYPWNEYVIYLQEDGRWLIESILDEEDDWFHFEPEGLYHNSDGMCYGEYTGERDVTKVDWQTVPHTFTEALAHMADSWGVVGCDRIPLRSGPSEAMQQAALCCYGAPVQVLGMQGDWAYVAVLGGELTGWLPADTLLLGAEQMITVSEYGDMWGMYSWRVSAAFGATQVKCFGGTVLLDAPEGSVLWEDVSGDTVQLVCELEDGWNLVCWPDSLGGGYIRAEYTTLEYAASIAPNLTREFFPDCTLVFGDARDGAATLLLDRPDGTRVLVCGVYEADAWVWTESTPLPAGTLLACPANGDAALSFCRSELEGEAELCVIIRQDDDGAWRIHEIQADSGFNWMYADGMLMAEDGTEAPGLPGFETDVRYADWQSLPATLEEALTLLSPTP